MIGLVGVILNLVRVNGFVCVTTAGGVVVMRCRVRMVSFIRVHGVIDVRLRVVVLSVVYVELKLIHVLVRVPQNLSIIPVIICVLEGIVLVPGVVNVVSCQHLPRGCQYARGH